MNVRSTMVAAPSPHEWNALTLVDLGHVVLAQQVSITRSENKNILFFNKNLSHIFYIYIHTHIIYRHTYRYTDVCLCCCKITFVTILACCLSTDLPFACTFPYMYTFIYIFIIISPPCQAEDADAKIFV